MVRMGRKGGAAAFGRRAPPLLANPGNGSSVACTVGCTGLMYSLYLDCEWTYLEHIWERAWNVNGTEMERKWNDGT